MPRASVVDEAVIAVRRLVGTEQFGPGSRLPSERELAEALDASRATIREALRQLAETGLLETRRGSGTYVASVDLREVFVLRLLLEPYAAACTAERRSTDELAALQALVRELKRTLADPVAFSDVDGRIHQLIARAAGNKLLFTTLGNLDELTRLSRLMTSGDTAVRRQTAEHMRHLAVAVRGRRAIEAAQAMRAHLEALEERAEPARSDRLHRIRALVTG